MMNPFRQPNTSIHLSEVVIKPLECVTNERQAHLWRLLDCSAGLEGLCLEDAGIISLINLISREVGGVNVGGQARLERRADTAETIKLDTAEESMALDLVSTTATQTVLRVADHAIFLLTSHP
jgi:hypothetical protein